MTYEANSWTLVPKTQTTKEEKLPNDFADLVAAAPMGKEISNACLDIMEMLLKKNISYGNSALDPVRIFSKMNALEQLLVRIDDKLSRLQKGSKYPGDNDVDDLIGYLVLLKVRLNDA